VKLATAAEIAAVDRCASACHGLAVAELMERAGRCVADAAELLLGPVRGRRIAFVCGRGNNGGDGLVASRVLRTRGAEALVILGGPPAGWRPDAARAWEASRDAGIELLAAADAASLAAARARVSDADLVVDALLGTGFCPPARDLAQDAIRFVNALGLPVLAVDIPSGLAADNGRVEGDAVRATATVTFGYPKPGLVLHPAARHVGRLWLADIGLPPGTDSLVAGDLNLATPRDIASHLAPRDPESHKGSFGHVLLVAGSRGMVGAASLAARGALRAGAGLVTVGLPASVAPPQLPGLPEAMVLSLPDAVRQPGEPDAAALIVAQLSRFDVLAAGPGLSREHGPARLVRELSVAGDIPLLLDADALHALADAGPGEISRRRTPAVLTPHPGELSRLLGMSAAQIQADRIGAARTCAERFNAVVVLKGSRTVIAPPAGAVWINPTGNPGMAAAGMGDVLTGVIAAHLARGMAPLVAALLGTYLHGLAGDLAVADVGPWGILASEVADRIPAAVKSLGNPDDAPVAALSLLLA
jgi:NAD(P)H-hydrate epimerase